jgi:hypothetical protein
MSTMAITNVPAVAGNVKVCGIEEMDKACNVEAQSQREEKLASGVQTS